MSIPYKLLVIVSILLSHDLHAGTPPEIAQSVLDKLYKAHGHFSPHKPKLKFVTSKENVASYIKYNNTIQIEEQAYLLCRSFGKDSLSALAFLLGHELIHAIQINNVLPKTSFINYNKSLRSSIEIEQNADIQGIFLSYLAGYHTVDIIPEIIERMYTVYELRTKNIKGYPTEEERKASYKPVIDQANQLIELFKLSNELSVIEEYQTAIQCLEYITRFYQGKEVYNNLGVNYTLMALNFTRRNTETFIYPMELDWNSRIKKPKTGRGEEEMNPIEKIQQQQYFLKAKNYFSLASDLDPNYIVADLNSFCVLIMMNDLKAADQFYRNHLRRFSNKTEQKELFLKIKSANAILLAKKDNTTEAITIWNDLKKEKSDIIATQANQNLNYLAKNPYLQGPAAVQPCIALNTHDIPGANFKLRNVETHAWIQLDTTNGIEKTRIHNTTVYSSVVNRYTVFTIQKIPIPRNQKPEIDKGHLVSLGNNQWICRCKKENEAFILNEDGEVVIKLRYQYFKEALE